MRRDLNKVKAVRRNEKSNYLCHCLLKCKEYEMV